MSDGEYGGPTGRYDGDWLAAEPYPQPPVISAPPQPLPQKTNTFATLSVVFAFLFAPVGAVLGHLGLSQIRRTGQRVGRGFRPCSRGGFPPGPPTCPSYKVGCDAVSRGF